MKKITLDLSNSYIENEILSFQNKVTEINTKIKNKTSAGSDFLGWVDLASNYDKNEYQEMEKVANFLHKEKVETLVVIGIGGSYLGAKAAIDFVQGQTPLKSEQKMKIVFAGTSISSSSLYRLLENIKDQKFAINVISKSGKTTEPAVAFREFKNLLEKNVGKEKAKDLIFVTTDKARGTLFDFATKKQYKKFVISDDVGGRFSVLSPVGLLPMMCAGVDTDKILSGALQAAEQYSLDDLSQNDAYKYAVARNILHKKYAAEMLVSYEPDMLYFNEWWKQLFGESEGKESKGLLPTSAIFSTDLHSLGQFIQEGSKVLFETVITLLNPKHNIKLSIDDENLDELNYLAGKTLHEVNNAAFKATTSAHYKEGQVPNIHLLLESNTEENLGWLFMFFERACAMSAYILGVNPFDQPGVEVYKTNMFKILGK